MYTRTGLTTLALLLFTACGDDASKTSDADSTGATDSTGAASDSTTGDTTGDMPTTGVTTTSSDNNTSTTDPTTTTEGETTGSVDPEDICEAFCAHAEECNLPGDTQADCTADCLGDLARAEGACKVAMEDMASCFLGLTCEQLLSEDDNSCAATEQAVEDACQEFEEECGFFGGGTDEECGVSYQCDAQPDRTMTCTAETCTCTTGGEKIGECKTEGACMDLDGLEAKFEACCGL